MGFQVHQIPLGRALRQPMLPLWGLVVGVTDKGCELGGRSCNCGSILCLAWYVIRGGENCWLDSGFDSLPGWRSPIS